jgi:outer membrane protein assembly factor BamA
MARDFRNQAGVRTSLFQACLLFLAVCACASTAGAQETRADVLAEERAAKTEAADTSVALGPGRLARTFSWAEAKLDGGSGTHEGFYPELGGMITGAGISVGPGYRHYLFGDRALVDASAAASWRRYSTFQSRIEWPRLFEDRLAVGAQVKYQDFTQINFFGIGGASLKANQTDFRLNDVDVLGFATVQANRWLSVGGRVGVLRSVNVARGTSTLYPSTGDVFEESSAPSLTRQPGFVHSDVFLDIDARDVPGYPTSGGRYRLSASAFHDQNYSQYSFRRVEADASQYIPLLHKSWVLALRGRMAMSETSAGQEVPFYLLPTLGGPTTLRGFSDYRFRDRNLLLLNAEYRWPIFRALDGALFYDAGTVSAHALSIQHPHTDYGAGVRLHSTTRTLVRLDFARSREGSRVIFSFTAPFGASSRTVVPYVP